MCLNANRNSKILVNEKQSSMQIRTPAKAATHTIDGILVAIYEEKYDRNIDGFKVFLSNRESASFFLQQKFNMEGSRLEAAGNPSGFHQYRLKGRLWKIKSKTFFILLAFK